MAVGGRGNPAAQGGERVVVLAAAGGGDAVYGLGLIGAAVWFWQQADGFWEHVYGIFQGIFWPAYMVFDRFYLERYGLAGYRGEGPCPDWLTGAGHTVHSAARGPKS